MIDFGLELIFGIELPEIGSRTAIDQCCQRSAVIVVNGVVARAEDDLANGALVVDVDQIISIAGFDTLNNAGCCEELVIAVTKLNREIGEPAAREKRVVAAGEPHCEWII